MRFRRYRGILAAGFIVTGLSVGIPTIVYGPSGGAAGPSGGSLTANVWISPNGSEGGSSCVARSASLIAAPADPTQACSFPTATGTGGGAQQQKAYDLSQAGDVIGVMTGNYTTANSGFYIRRTGSAHGATPTVLKCAIQAQCVITKYFALGSTGNTGDAAGSGPSNFTLDGLKITAGFSAEAYVNSYQLDGIVFKNNKIVVQNAGTFAGGTSCSGVCSGAPLNFTDSKNITIQNNDIGPICCALDGIRIQNGSAAGFLNTSGVTITGNNIHDIYNTCTDEPAAVTAADPCSGYGTGDGCNGSSCEHVDGIQMSGAAGLTITNNKWYAAGNQTLFLQCFNSNAAYTNILIQNNLISNQGSIVGGGSGFSIGVSCSPTGTVSGFVHIYYNTIQQLFGMYGGAGVDNGFVAGTDVKVIGNIIGNNARCTFNDSTGGTITPTWQYNLFGAGSCAGTGNATGTATFVAGSNPYDLRLSGAQTAVNGAEAVAGNNCAAVTPDYFGTARPLGSFCDMGGAENS